MRVVLLCLALSVFCCEDKPPPKDSQESAKESGAEGVWISVRPEAERSSLKLNSDGTYSLGTKSIQMMGTWAVVGDGTVILYGGLGKEPDEEHSRYQINLAEGSLYRGDSKEPAFTRDGNLPGASPFEGIVPEDPKPEAWTEEDLDKKAKEIDEMWKDIQGGE